MKTLLSFLFVLVMVSSSASQTIQNIIGVWAMQTSGMDDSLKYDCIAAIKFDERGKFEYIHSFKMGKSEYNKTRAGNWKMSGTHKITLTVRLQETNDYVVGFKKTNILMDFILSKDKKSADFYGDNMFSKISSFEKIDVDFSTKENYKSPQKVLAKKKGIVI